MQDAGNLGDILRYSLISVIDNGQGLRPKKLLETLQMLETSRDQTRHIGLANTHKQLMLTYGEPYVIILRSKFGWGTSVHLTIPKD